LLGSCHRGVENSDFISVKYLDIGFGEMRWKKTIVKIPVFKLELSKAFA